MIEASISELGPQVIRETGLEVDLDHRYHDIHLIRWIMYHHNFKANIVIGLLILVRAKIPEDRTHSIMEILVK